MESKSADFVNGLIEQAGSVTVACSRSASREMFAFSAASIFRLGFFIIRSVYHDGAEPLQSSRWSQNRGPPHQGAFSHRRRSPETPVPGVEPAAKEWKMPPREWAMAKAQLAILFDDRFTLAL